MNLIETDEVKLRKLTADGDALRMKIPVLAAGITNQNKRCYSLQVIKAAVNELKGRLAKRSTFGSTSHVRDLELDQVSHTVEDIELDDKGVAHAIVRILGTQKGKNLQAILAGGGAVGCSARGAGDVDEKGNVKDGYKLLGVDFCLNPSFAFHVNRAAMFESASLEEDEPVTLAELETMGLIDEKPKTEADLQARYYAAIQAGYKGDFAAYKDVSNKPAADSRIETDYTLAVKDSGYKGSLEQYRAAHLVK